MIGHPRRRELTAWFDGEGSEEIGYHVARCPRCTRVVDDFGLVRWALRGEARAAPPRTRPFLLRTSPGLAIGVTLLVGLILGSAAPQPQWDAPARLASRAFDRFSPDPDKTSPTTAAPAAPTSVEEVATQGQAPVPTAPETTQLPAQARGQLELATMTPADGPGAEEARAVQLAARAAVDAANRAGGVNGLPIQLTNATYKMGESPTWRPADAYVGGFVSSTVSPPDIPWLLPAEPGVKGAAVLRAEVTPREAGRRMAEALAGQPTTGVIGVVVGAGDEAQLAAGLDEVAEVVRAGIDPRGDCDAALFDLRRQGVVALALAGPPAMVAICADAALGMGWRPSSGLLVAPSIAYSSLQHRLSLQDARTVLGLPWPSASSPGAERFRAAVPTSVEWSYRAMVTFAAAELAVLAAREGAGPGQARQRIWQTDLFRLDHGINVGAAIVQARDDGWERSP